MAKRSRTAVKQKARSRGRLRGSLKKVWKAAVPPPDDPLLRHRETTADIRIIPVVPERNAIAPLTASRARGSRGAVRGLLAPPLTADRAQVANRRLTALQHARASSRVEQAGAVRALAVTGVAPGGVPPPPVAPVTGANNWVQLGPTAIPNGQTYGGVRVLVTGRVTNIAIDPTNHQVIYIGTAQGGVWKTTDGGTHWRPCSDNEASLAIGALAIDPANTQIIYAGTGEGNFSGDSYYGAGVLRSTNGGASWTLLGGSAFTGSRFGRIAVTPGTTARIFAATSGGV